MNGSIHVRELSTVLQQNDIPYQQGGARFCGRAAGCTGCGGGAGVCGAVLWLRRRGAASGEAHAVKAVLLPVFWPAADGWTGSGNAGGAGAGATAGSDAEVSRALHPENILVRSGTLELKRAHGAGKRPGARVRRVFRTGIHNGSAGMAAAVYFWGRAVCALQRAAPRRT